MATNRRPKGAPWYFTQIGTWCATIDGNRVNLGVKGKGKANEVEAFRVLAEKLAEKDDVAKLGEDARVGQLIDEFLEWAKIEVKRKRLEQRTYDTASRFLIGSWSKKTGEKLSEGFRDFIGNKRVRELTGIDVLDWLDERYPEAADNTLRGAVQHVKRVFSWACQNPNIKPHQRSPVKLIDSNPIADVEVPAYVPNRAWLSDEQWATVMDQYDDSFRDMLQAALLTGCRPGELRQVEARHYVRSMKRWEFPRTESKGKISARIVTLVPEMVEMTERLVEQYPSGPLFRNRDGDPWSDTVLPQRLVRLKRKMRNHLEETGNLDEFPGFNSLEDISKVRLYTGRKTFITNALKRGVDLVTTRHLANHKSMHMISTVYAAVEQDLDHMQAAAMKAIGNGPSITPAEDEPTTDGMQGKLTQQLFGKSDG